VFWVWKKGRKKNECEGLTQGYGIKRNTAVEHTRLVRQVNIAREMKMDKEIKS
jgi:hypothetical protein